MILINACEECDQPEVDGHVIYQCEKCHKEVCSDCSKNDPDDDMTVLCLGCFSEGRP